MIDLNAENTPPIAPEQSTDENKSAATQIEIEPTRARARKRWLNPLGIAAIILALIFTALIVHNEHHSRSAALLVPLNADFYFLTPLAKNHDRNDVNQFDAWDDLRHEFFGVLPLTVAGIFNRAITHYGFAQLAHEKMLIVKCGNAWDLQKMFAAPEFTRQRLENNFPNSYALTFHDDRLFFAMLKPYAVWTKSEELLNQVIGCWQQKNYSLGVLPAFRVLPEKTASEFFVRPSNTTILTRNGQTLFPLPASFSADDGLAGKIKRHAATQWTAQLSLVDLHESALPPLNTHGFFYYLLWTLAVILLIIVGLPILFLLTVILVAVWFHITSRWHGIKHPRVAPALPEMSPELQADLKLTAEPRE